ncbi:MAG: hypothetical protein ACLRQT_05335 [Alistipes sp.]
MDKNRFRNISFCAIGALLALALVQAWSLWRMYADRAEEFSRKVTLAMNRAAYDDLLIGNRRRTSQTRTSVVTTGNIDSVKLDMIDTISVKSLGAAGKVLSIRSKVDTLRTNIALRRGDKTRYIYQEVRMPSFTASVQPVPLRLPADALPGRCRHRPALQRRRDPRPGRRRCCRNPARQPGGADNGGGTGGGGHRFAEGCSADTEPEGVHLARHHG